MTLHLGRASNLIGFSGRMTHSAAFLMLILMSIICRAQDFEYSNFDSISGLVLNGNAAQGSPVGPETATVLRLTNTTWEASSAWYSTPVTVSNGFTVTFDFDINSCAPYCADGFAFIIQNSKNRTTSLGPGGGYLGYGYVPPDNTSIENSLAIEFDTLQNGWDPNSNHVAVQSCGTQPNTADHSECNLSINPNIPITLTDSANHSVSITYAPGTLTTSIDGSVVMTTSVNLASLLSLNGNSAYVGFTAGSGSGGENADILNWSFISGGLVFPVRQDDTYCTRNGVGSGQCTPTTARIAAVFDHEMKTAYEEEYKYDKVKGQCVLKKKPAGYGTIIDFEDEAPANLSPLPGPLQGYGRCETLYGYTNANGSAYLADLNYRSSPNQGNPNSYLWYDSHPGYDYPFNYLTGVYPAISGCASYKISAAGASHGAYHVLSITPLSTEPQGGVCPANIASETGYVVFYLHLASYLNGKKPVYCQTPIKGSARCQKQVACPNCPSEGQWISVNASQPIAYVGDFSNGQWGGVSPHLHFEVDYMPNQTAMPIPIDPYGWCGPPRADPYTKLTGQVNMNLWGASQYTCPGGGR